MTLFQTRGLAISVPPWKSNVSHLYLSVYHIHIHISLYLSISVCVCVFLSPPLSFSALTLSFAALQVGVDGGVLSSVSLCVSV